MLYGKGGLILEAEEQAREEGRAADGRWPLGEQIRERSSSGDDHPLPFMNMLRPDNILQAKIGFSQYVCFI